MNPSSAAPTVIEWYTASTDAPPQQPFAFALSLASFSPIHNNQPLRRRFVSTTARGERCWSLLVHDAELTPTDTSDPICCHALLSFVVELCHHETFAIIVDAIFLASILANVVNGINCNVDYEYRGRKPVGLDHAKAMINEFVGNSCYISDTGITTSWSDNCSDEANCANYNGQYRATFSDTCKCPPKNSVKIDRSTKGEPRIAAGDGIDQTAAR